MINSSPSSCHSTANKMNEKLVETNIFNILIFRRRFYFEHVAFWNICTVKPHGDEHWAWWKTFNQIDCWAWKIPNWIDRWFSGSLLFFVDLGPIHLPLMDGPSVKCVWYRTIIFSSEFNETLWSCTTTTWLKIKFWWKTKKFYSNREAIWLFKRAHWITNDHFKRLSVTYEWPLNYECPFQVRFSVTF